MWVDHAERDRRNPKLLGKDGEFHTYEELLGDAGPAIEEELKQEVWERKYRRGQEAVAELTGRLAKARPDVAVVIGDDQREIFGDEGFPIFGCFLGDELVDRPPTAEQAKRIPKGIRAASWAAHSEQPTTHRTSAALSRHLVESLADADFDVLTFSRQPADTTLGHAFTFPRYRLGLSPGTPIAPVFINTYYPPNVPSAGRCYRLGQVIGQAVASWPDDVRVAVIASGGLSHFVIDEELDHRILGSLEAGDPGPLCCIPRNILRSGNSEILNWIAAAGALGNLRASVVDYIPSYRSPAGTGTGMAFVHWE
jgi:3-O-methylgallate 3,4-dioxygenase